ncbi:MAG: DUF4177 domain-containing protein [bacterium]|nr:DUF4177 domain-containing protein [bacterium]
MFEYKVLTHKDRALSGKFDPQKLENALNDYAEQGWRVLAATTANFGGMSNRQEFIAVLEREK